MTNTTPTPDEALGVRTFRRGGRTIRILMFRNSGRSFGGRLLLGDHDMPILDGPTPEAVMELARDVWDAVELVRAPAA